MERKELLDKVKKLERCERQERDRFLRERAAKEAVLQARAKGLPNKLIDLFLNLINVVNSYILINLLTLLQEYNGLQKSFDRFKEILKEQEDPVSKSHFDRIMY